MNWHDGNIVIGLHEVQNRDGEEQGQYYFPQPTMTFFAGDMAERIAALRADGLSFVEDYDGGPGNAILVAPGAQRNFLFEGDI